MRVDVESARSALIQSIKACDCGSTGAPDMLKFHQFVARECL